jgi:predicted nucleic acid-binding protein
VLLYLDLNCFNRPFDDQNQMRVAEETEAVFSILQRIEDGTDELAWSGALTFENSQHPLEDRRDEIARWEQRASSNLGITDAVAERARELVDAGFHDLDSVHLACAETAGCDRFLTCDDRLLRRAVRVQLMVDVQNPVDYVEDFPND